MKTHHIYTWFVAFILFMSLMIQEIAAQGNYQSATLITAEGEQLTGFIDYGNWDKNPRRIRFKSSGTADKQVFKPFEVQSFQVADQRYVGAIVNTEVGLLPNDELSNEDDISLHLKIDTVFLQTLIGGDRSLLFYKDNWARENFYIEEEGKYVLLGFKGYGVYKSSGMSELAEENEYIGQLTYYLQACLELGRRIEMTYYNQEDLVNIFRDYYECRGKPIEFEKTVERVQFKLVVLGGLSGSTLNFVRDRNSSERMRRLAAATYSSSIRPAVGIGVEIFLPRKNKHLTLCGELLFTTFQVDGRLREELSPTYIIDSESEFTYSYLKMNTMMRYRYPMRDIRLLVTGGIVNGFAIKQESQMNTNTGISGFEFLDSQNPAIKSRAYEQSLLAGVGLAKENLSLECRGEFGNGMAASSQLKANTRRIYILAGWTF